MLKLFVALLNISTPPRNTFNNALNVITDLCCCKQTVYKVTESVFFLFFVRPMEGLELLNCSRVFKATGWSLKLKQKKLYLFIFLKFFLFFKHINIIYRKWGPQKGCPFLPVRGDLDPALWSLLAHVCERHRLYFVLIVVSKYFGSENNFQKLLPLDGDN